MTEDKKKVSTQSTGLEDLLGKNATETTVAQPFTRDDFYKALMKISRPLGETSEKDKKQTS